MQAVILAAGVGTRLGRPFPKSLSILPTGERILGRQIRLLREAGIRSVTVVVGFKKSLIMEEYPEVLYSYNPVYYVTNTSKSLLHALRHKDDDIIWMNGDVIFDPEILHTALSSPTANLVCVDKKRCADEEVKYRVNEHGMITELSKTVPQPQGEAVGINIVRKEHLPAFVAALESCHELDYFEKAIETCIQQGMLWQPLDISTHRCIEVDFLEDWEAAQKLFPEHEEQGIFS
ncbi:MAG: phosphocholine cytidylyltransferase family protein [Desulfovibrionaceae bacterium]